MLCIHLVIIYRRTSDRSNFALRRTARKLTAHAHRCVKLKQGRPLHARPGQGKLTRLLGCYWLSGKLIGSLHTHASHTWLLAVIGRAKRAHMGDTSGIFHILLLYIIVRTSGFV